jgi:hypothetical protein
MNKNVQLDNLNTSGEEELVYDIVTYIFGDCEDGTCGYIQVENRSEFASKGDDVIQYRES